MRARDVTLLPLGCSRPNDDSPLLPSGANGDVTRLHDLIDPLHAGDGPAVPLHVLVHGSPREARFFSRLAAEGYDAFALRVHEKAVPKL